nr:hypothetical protein [Tanacetum cinerariifolium]
MPESNRGIHSHDKVNGVGICYCALGFVSVFMDIISEVYPLSISCHLLTCMFRRRLLPLVFGKPQNRLNEE